ncbi:uncharacterized protein PG998_013813 [Apiospora kogelbergensis]|uniref:uncharacterized protein n=1 Tax=Apiospora kogelbergensis TaxID=1337665 RepID=UPI00312D238B
MGIAGGLGPASPLIAQLYIEQGKPLKEVVDILERDHGFKATAKMYKLSSSLQFNQKFYRDRFKQWSLYKYNSLGPSESAHKRSLAQRRGRSTLVEEKGEPMLLKTDRSSISGSSVSGSSTSEFPEDAIAIKVEPTTDLPVFFTKNSGQGFGNIAAYPYPRLHSSPDSPTLTEVFLRLSNQFMVSNAELQVSYTAERTTTWWSKVESAARLLDSQCYQEGLRILGNCFDDLVVLLQNPEPAIIPAIYMCFLRLPPELKRQFIAYVAKLAAIKLPRGHPLILMWNKFRESETGDLERNAYHAVKTHFDLMEDSPYKSKTDGIMLAGRTYDMFDFIRDKDHNLYTDTEEIITKAHRIMQFLERQGCMDRVVITRLTLGYLHWRHKRYDEARACANEILQWRQTLPPEEQALWKNFHPLRLMYLIELDVGTWEDYKKFSHEYIQLCYKGLGPEHHRTRTALLEVQRSYRERGLDEEAEALPGIFLRELEPKPDY